MAGPSATSLTTGSERPGLSVHLVPSLIDVVEPVLAHLARVAGRDPFAVDRIIVPNAGVRAWLLQQVAHRNAATPGRRDGIVARVEVGYTGMLQSLVRGTGHRDEDPWSIEAMTLVILREIVTDARYKDLLARHDNRPLRAARVMADRFDSYHARRPSMIEEWEAGHPVLAPEVGEPVAPGEWMRIDRDLSAADVWQFELWRRVREEIGVPSPPVQVSEALARIRRGETGNLPDRLLVVGLQGLPAHYLRILSALAEVSSVSVHLIHPSPALARRWADGAREFTGVREAIDARRAVTDDATATDVASVWLRGAMEMQVLLAAHGIDARLSRSERSDTRDDLLRRVQIHVADPGVVRLDAPVGAPPDRSFSIHRGHTLARQVEILHDALLHAFSDLPDLEPHDVVILCPDMAAAAPLLEAVFHRDVSVSATGSEGTSEVRIPLVVADRGLREVSEAALVLSRLISVLTGRVSRSDLLGLFDHESVLRGVGVGDDAVEFWERLLEASGMHWGLSDEHRARHGLAVDLVDAHTWLSTLRQSLLGVLVPDAAPAHEVAGVPALTDLDTADVPAVAALVHLIAVVMRAERESRGMRSVSGWCDLLEGTLIDLCGATADMESVSGELARLRRASAMAGDTANEPVTFADAAPMLEELLTAVPGRQPLRTGAVTATSMVPLRSVPFRVVCVLGYDDGVVAAADTEGDDLLGRQRHVGDIDPRIDARRALLDAVLAAGDRVIVTCTGRHPLNNKPVPFTTALAELVDLCVSVGGGHRKVDGEDRWDFVNDHPRHAFSEGNFITEPIGGIDPAVVADGRPWSHDTVARRAAEQVAVSSAAAPLDSVPVLGEVEPRSRFSLDDLVRVLTYPVDFYFESIGVDKWDDILTEEPDEAIIPMDPTTSLLRRLIADWAGVVDTTPAPDFGGWSRAVSRRGLLPVGGAGEGVLDTVRSAVADTRALLRDNGFATTAPVPFDLGVALPSGRRIDQRVHRPESSGVAARIAYFDDDRERKRVRLEAALELLIRRAAGDAADTAAVVWIPKNKDAYQIYRVHLGDGIDGTEAVTRLESLLDAVEVARTFPCLPFGDAGTRAANTSRETEADFREALVGAMEDWVEKEEYPGTREALFHGENPPVGLLCGEDSPWREFWRRVGRVSNGQGPPDPEYRATQRPLPGSQHKIRSYVLS